MNMKTIGSGAGLLTAVLGIGVWLAATSVGGADVDAVAKLKLIRPDLPIERVSAAPIEGMTIIELSGGTMLYATADGRHLFAGDLYEIRGDELVNLAEERRDEMRKSLLDAVPTSEMTVFPANGLRKASIMVFTDVDCGFCRKLHKEVPQLNALGIEVRYLAYPRQGVGSPVYDKMVSAWCSKDRNSAMTKLKNGESIPPAQCDNPIASQYELGQEIGVSGTPAIVFESGRLQPGYTPAAELAAAALL